MKEGLPGQLVQQMMDYEARGLKVKIEFKEFMEGLTNTFRDVNKGATAQEQLSKKLSREDVSRSILPSVRTEGSGSEIRLWAQCIPNSSDEEGLEHRGGGHGLCDARLAQDMGRIPRCSYSL
jgi:hypothetical protein